MSFLIKLGVEIGVNGGEIKLVALKQKKCNSYKF
jgi:hypothetical protein